MTHHDRSCHCELCDCRHGLWSAFFLGLAIFAVGAVLILDNFGVIYGSMLAPYWPVLLVVVGVSHLVRSSSPRRLVWGLSWIAIGAIILANNLGLIAVGIGELWPVVLVIIGAGLLLRGARPPGHRVGDGGKTGPEAAQ